MIFKKFEIIFLPPNFEHRVCPIVSWIYQKQNNRFGNKEKWIFKLSIYVFILFCNVFFKYDWPPSVFQAMFWMLRL